MARIGDMQQISVVISGFGPYPEEEINPSYEVPSTLERYGLGESGGPANSEFDGLEITISAVRLPMDCVEAWAELHTTLEAMKPNIVIATGLKRRARGVLLERCATSPGDTYERDAGRVAGSPAVRQGPAAYWTSLPLRAIIDDFTRYGIPASLSSDAGVHVGNALFYDLLHWTASQKRVLSGFVNLPHIAASEHSQHGLSMKQQVQAGRSIILQSIRYYLQPSSGDILLA